MNDCWSSSLGEGLLESECGKMRERERERDRKRKRGGRGKEREGEHLCDGRGMRQASRKDLKCSSIGWCKQQTQTQEGDKQRDKWVDKIKQVRCLEIHDRIPCLSNCVSPTMHLAGGSFYLYTAMWRGGDWRPVRRNGRLNYNSTQDVVCGYLPSYSNTGLECPPQPHYENFKHNNLHTLDTTTALSYSKFLERNPKVNSTQGMPDTCIIPPLQLQNAQKLLSNFISTQHLNSMMFTVVNSPLL